MFSGLERLDEEDEVDELEDEEVLEEDESLVVVGRCREESSAASETWSKHMQ